MHDAARVERRGGGSGRQSEWKVSQVLVTV